MKISGSIAHVCPPEEQAGREEEEEEEPSARGEEQLDSSTG